MENKKVNSFIEQFCSNSEGVLTTITNQPVEIIAKEIEKFDFNQISENIELPAILVTLSFTDGYNFSSHVILSKKLVAILADLMMLGDGDVDYNPEEHNDAVQEMINQILGSLVAELSAQEIKLTGMATDVEVTDMEIQKEFMVDDSFAAITLNLLDQNFPMYFIVDKMASDSIEEMLKNVAAEDEVMPNSTPNTASGGGNSFVNNAPQQQHPEVNIARPTYAEMDEEDGQIVSKINLDLLLDITLPVTVELGKKNMKIRQILELGQGSIVELDKLVGDHVELMVNGKKFAMGEIMVADENLAIRVVNLISREERIRTLGE